MNSTHQPDVTNNTETSADHYVERRGQELRQRYQGTREQRKKIAEQMDEASQYQLMLAKFKKHRVATISLVVLVLLYLIAIFAEFVAPYEPLQRFDNQIYASPTTIHITDESGNITLPFVYETISKVDLKTFSYHTQVVDRQDPLPNPLVCRKPALHARRIHPDARTAFWCRWRATSLLIGRR